MSAVDDVIEAWEHGGWVAARCQKVNGSSPNPTRVDLVRGKQKLFLLIYAWKVTLEGKGRIGKNYRIQTTRSHSTDLLTEPNRLTIGFGIDTDRDVMAVFDGWTKRATGRSSSVHIERAMLEAAQRDGYAQAGPPWDSRAATRIVEPDNLLSWINKQREMRTAAVQPVEYLINEKSATVVVDLWSASPAAWLRQQDRLIIADFDNQTLLDTALWTVESVDVSIVNPGERYPRRRATFKCRRAGRVRGNAADVIRELSGGRNES
ncbi:hypothetical protein [Rhodococcus pyridinivorans]